MAALRTRRNDAQPGSRKQVSQRDSKGKTIHPKTNTGKPRAAAMHTRTIDTGEENSKERKDRVRRTRRHLTRRNAAQRRHGTSELPMATLGTLAEKRFAGQVARKGRDERQHRMPHTAPHANRNTRTRTHGWQQKPQPQARLLRRDRWKDSSRARNGREFPWSHATPARHRIAQGRSCAQTTDRNKPGKTTATPLGWRHGKQGTSENGAGSNSGSEPVSGETKAQDTVGETEHTGCATTGEQGGKEVTKRRLEARLRRTVFWKAAPKKKRHTAGTRTK
ncbi:hypothetical protein, conserved in T. vivax [Trypanosoma vivax Y486]|uniref:Uncharacterized protein n=1 Tax=Trypanosoma vivax (strain Y486) TaxID=1055687 RepID=F9WSQ0_TRYVY|nr:hypothetical protein, conserved in T. vivax [Trypanosoma vivax Y486]|eukprot:CCD20589.1 hypothetical protein, conserved in T. vivax [Trypanosoma vivax Y486]